MSSARSFSREIGTAFAVLAIYLLTVLAPLHHARASQFAFEQLGYSALETAWVLCSSVGAEGEDGDATIAKCPATGVGKAQFVLPAPAALPVLRDVAALAAPLLVARPVFPPRAIAPPAGPRAPPALV